MNKKRNLKLVVPRKSAIIKCDGASVKSSSYIGGGSNGNNSNDGCKNSGGGIAVEQGAKTNKKSLLISITKSALGLVGLCISAGIAIPIGPVPFTLQILVLGIIVATLSPREALCATLSYLAIGMMGAPVFSGYIGGIARIIGPSGGFLYGFIPAVLAGTCLRCGLQKTVLPYFACAFAGIICTIAISYFFGCAHLIYFAQMTPEAAFSISCAPFIGSDIIKAVIAVGIVAPIYAKTHVANV